MPEETLLETTVEEMPVETAPSETVPETSPIETEEVETMPVEGIPLNTDVTLNPQQAAAGYQVIDGKIYAPGQEPGASKNGIHYGGVATSSDTGFVTFKAEVPTGVHDDAYINLINMNTYEEYQIVLYEANKWSTTVSLPDAAYIMDTSGLVTDSAKRYWTERLRFNVTAGSSTVQTLLFNDSLVETTVETTDAELESIKAETGIEENESTVYETETSAETVAETGARPSAGNIVFVGICVFVPLLIASIIAIKKRNKRKEGFF